MYWHHWPYNRYCPNYPLNPYMGIPACPPQYPVSPGMEYPACPPYPVSPGMEYPACPQYPVSPGMEYPACPQYPVSPGMEYPAYPPQYPVSPGMEYPAYPPQYPVSPGMEYPAYPPQYPVSPGMEYPLPPGTPYYPPGSPSGPVAGEQEEAGSPLTPAVWPAPIPSPGGSAVSGAELPPMPPVPWTSPGATSPSAGLPCPPCYSPWPPYQPPVTGSVAQPMPDSGLSDEVASTEPIQGGTPVLGSPVKPEIPGAPAALTSPDETPGELVEVEPGEATPGEPESIAAERENTEQLTPGSLLGTIEGAISVRVDNRPVRPLANQLVLIYNRATGERFQAYTNNQGFYSRRVPEGRYIVQIRQRISAPFVRQRLARVQALHRTAANVNVACAGITSESSDDKRRPRIKK